MALQMTWQPGLLSQKRKTGPPLGLRNLGNTCYLNSVLQCLTYTAPLANFCLKFQHSSSCDLAKEREKKIECPFCILEKRIVRSLSIDQALDAPQKINNCLRIFSEHFRLGRQEDAHEFLRYVIDACHNTCIRLNKLQQLRGKAACVSNGADCFSTNGNTVVKEIFGGALQSQVKCLSCGTESNKVDEIMDISLDILHSGSLKEALHKFFEPEVLDGNNKYSCKKLVTARKQMSVAQAPNVLVIQLKRFEGLFGGKIDKAIAFHEVLVLSNYMCKASQDLHPEYNLFGTIVHSGFSSDSGHYYAYVKDTVGRWYCCNDSYVTLSNSQEVLSEKVYILFFARTKQRTGFANSVLANGVRSQNSHSEDTPKTTSSSVKSLKTGNHFFNGNIANNNSDYSKENKVPSTPQAKLGTTGNYGTKKNSGNISFKIVNNKHESNGKKRDEKASTFVNQSDVKLPSVVYQNGVSEKIKSVDAVDRDESQAFAGKENFTSKECNSVEVDTFAGDMKDPAAVGRHHNRQGLQNGSLSISNDFGAKRKLQTGELCDRPLADLEKFKLDLQKEASLVLQSCGWTDRVYSFMHSRKKLCARQSGTDASNMKQFLIAEAKTIFIQQIPPSLKGSLIERLKSFCQEKQCSSTGPV